MSGGSNSAVDDALQRAREFATVDSSSNSSLKRSLGDDIDLYPAKRINTEMEPAGLVQMGSAPYMQMGMGENVVEVISIPDNTVGLVIGRGGSEIQNIQAQSQCRVQMSPDGESTTPGYRSCTLQGSKISVERAKQLITEVINRANQRQQQGTPGGGSGGMMNQSFGNDSRHITVEVLIPAAKCGLVIGKQGDTIKQLQEQAGCKMLMIQDSQEVTGQPKPLRITGDPDKVELAKRLISDLLSSRDDQSGGALVAHRPHHAEAATAKGEVVVPRTSVGMIIGKGGETIKRLAVETGTKIQFKPDDDPNSPDRCAVIMGTRDQIYKATELITELVHKSCNGGGPAGGGGPTATEVFYMHVPSNKTGLVIGKGGETIKQINNESGAHCELSRDPPPNSQEKVFIVKGTPYQIHHAQHIIRIKVGDLAPGTPVPPFNGAMNGGFNAQQQFGQPIQQNQWSGGYNQGDPAGGWAGQPQQAFYPTAAAQPGYAAAQFQQPTAQQFPAAAVAAQPAVAQNPGINPQTGQPDYSAQWAEYYRSMGMHDQAALIENQMKQNQAAAGVRTGTTPSATPATASSTPGQGTQYAGYTGAQQQSFPQTGQFSAQTPQY